MSHIVRRVDGIEALSKATTLHTTKKHDDHVMIVMSTTWATCIARHTTVCMLVRDGGALACNSVQIDALMTA